MAFRKRKSGSLCNDEDDATRSSERAQEIEIIGRWRPVDSANESFHLPHTVDADRYPTFNFRTASFLKIFLRFVTVPLVTKIAQDIDPADLTYDCGSVILLSLCSIYKLLAIWIRIYGEQHASRGVIRHSRPLREQLIWYRDHFKDCYPRIDSLGIRFMEIVTTNFLFDSRYSKQLSHNFRSILRGIGNVVAGDEKLLHFSGVYIDQLLNTIVNK